jgi:hypothetical protein
MTNSYSLYSKESLSIIEDCNFLEKQDLLDVLNMSEELQDAFEKKQMWRTETEIEFSVLNDFHFPTNASKYWQSVREQSVFFENLVTLSFEYRRNIIKIGRLKEKLDNLRASKVTDQFDIQETLIDLEEAEFAKKNMEIAAKNRVRELRIWSKKKKELNDGSFDNKDVNNHQLLSYTKFYINKIFTVAQSQISADEKANIEGQLITCLRLCKERNLVNDVLSGFNKEQKEIIKKNLIAIQ